MDFDNKSGNRIVSGLFKSNVEMYFYNLKRWKKNDFGLSVTFSLYIYRYSRTSTYELYVKYWYVGSYIPSEYTVIPINGPKNLQ